MNKHTKISAQAECGPASVYSKLAKADGAKAASPLKSNPLLLSRPSIENPAKAGRAKAITGAATNYPAPSPDLTNPGGSRARSGHSAYEPQKFRARSQQSEIGESRMRPGQFLNETQPSNAGPQPFAGNGEGDDGAHSRSENHIGPSPVIAEIIQLWRMRQRWHRAEKALILQGKAICRAWTGGDKDAASVIFDALREGKEGSDPQVEMAVAPFLMAIGNFEPQRAAIEKRLRNLAKSLPVFPFIQTIRGFGELNLAALVGEAGDIASYRTPSCLWKRMGLAVISGERQRKKTDADAALLHGYNPGRRAVAYLIGDTMIKKQVAAEKDADGKRTGTSKPAGPYGAIYLARKEYEAARTDEGAAKTPAHINNRAVRFMVKRTLRDIWAASRKAEDRA